MKGERREMSREERNGDGTKKKRQIEEADTGSSRRTDADHKEGSRAA